MHNLSTFTPRELKQLGERDLGQIGAGTKKLPEKGIDQVITVVVVEQLEQMVEIEGLRSPNWAEEHRNVIAGLEILKRHPEVKKMRYLHFLENLRKASQSSGLDLHSEFESKFEEYMSGKIGEQDLENIRYSAAKRWLGEKDASLTFIEYLIPISDKANRIELWKIAIEKSPDSISTIFSRLQRYPNEAMEIIKLCIQRHPDQAIPCCEGLFRYDEEKRVELLKICAEKDPELTARNFHKFRIDKAEEREKLAYFFAERAPSVFLDHIWEFRSIPMPKMQPLLEICAQKDPMASAKAIQGLSYDYKQLLLESEGVRYEYAKRVIAAERLMDMKIVDLCGSIENMEMRSELLKLCAAQLKYVIDFIYYFKVSNETIMDIIKLCSENDFVGTMGRLPRLMNDFTLDNKIEIFKMIAAQNITLAIQKFISIIPEEKERIQLAKHYSEFVPAVIVDNISFFQIQDKKALKEILKICIRKDALEVSDLLDGLPLEPSEKMALAIECLNRDSTIDSYRNFANCEWAASEQAIAILGPLVEELEEGHIETIPPELEEIISWLHNKFYPELTDEKRWADALREDPNFELLFTLVWWMDVMHLSTEAQNGVYKLFPLVAQLPRPDLKWPLLREITHFLSNANATIPPLPSKEPGALSLLRLLSAQMVPQGFSQEEVDKLLDSALPTKALLVGNKQHALMEALLGLLAEDRISITAKEGLLELLMGDLPSYDNPTRRQKEELGKKMHPFLARAALLSPVLFLADPALLENADHLNLSEMLQSAFGKKVPLGKIDHFQEKYDKTFALSRDPSGLLRLAGKLSILNNPSVMTDLGTVCSAILEGTWEEMRHDIEKSAHLKKINENHAALLEAWFKPIESFSLQEVQATQMAERFDYLQWSKTKLLQDKHLDEFPLVAPIFSAFLEGTPPEEPEVQTPLDRALFSLLQATNEQEEEAALQALQSVDALVGSEFLNDIKGRLTALINSQKKLPEDLLVVETEGWIDLSLCGTEVPGSCQRLDGDPRFTKGILGYLKDGKIRMVAVKTKGGKLVARALIKLLWDGEKPVIFFETIYSSNDHPRLRAALIEMAKRKAKALGVPLLTVKEGNTHSKPYGRTLESLEGPATFEYSDASGGIAIRGKYRIGNPVFLT